MTPAVGPALSAAPIRILLVEDPSTSAPLASDFVERLGHRALVASEGAAAVHAFEAERPDIVLIDLEMSGVDGYGIAASIKAACGEFPVPVLFLTSRCDEASICRALQAGGEDFIAKPLGFAAFRIKIDALVRNLRTQRQLSEKSAELKSYYDASEAEQRAAGHLMKQLVHAERLRDPLLTYWLQPARNLSGDVIAAARTPGGVLHVLLGDGTGHGLAASLNVLPVVDPFYAMTEKGYGLGAIAREINAKMRSWLPVGNFVAATMVAYDPREGILEGWIGGNPSPFVLDRRGRMVYEFSNLHLPLGVLDDTAFDAGTEVMQLGPDCQLILHSDGVTEAESPDGVQFGAERLQKAFRSDSMSGRLERLKDALHGHCEGLSYSDDISIAIIDCIRTAQVAGSPAKKPAEPGSMSLRADWQVQLQLSAQELRYLDAVPMLLGLVGEFHCARSHRGELFLILSELFNNALDHGLLGLDSSLKNQAAGMERFLEVRQARLESLRDGSIEIVVRARPAAGHAVLEIQIRDSGPGFDFRPYLVGDCTANTAAHGRGISLVRSLCESVEFHGNGSEVCARFLPVSDDAPAHPTTAVPTHPATAAPAHPATEVPVESSALLPA